MTLSASRTTPPPATRNEAKLAASESLEDYTLRFAPRSCWKWAPGVVATSVLGGIAYLADFSTDRHGEHVLPADAPRSRGDAPCDGAGAPRVPTKG